MKILKRIAKWSLPVKLGVIGSICSICGLIIYFYDNPKAIIETSEQQSPIVSNNSVTVNFDYSTKFNVSELTSVKRRKTNVEEISYFDDWELGKFNTTITAVSGEKKYIVIDNDEGCFNVISQRDFDNNGTIDALVTDISACGGNLLGNSFFFISYLGNGHFQRTESFGDTWQDPVFEKWNGVTIVVYIKNNEGFNVSDAEEKMYRYILNSGKAILVEESTRMEIVALTELKASNFDNNNNEVLALKYDIDNDGMEDELSGSLWHRWGRIRWNVKLTKYGFVGGNIACKRIGVLASRTNGVNDLVCDQDQVLKFMEGEYKLMVR